MYSYGGEWEIARKMISLLDGYNELPELDAFKRVDLKRLLAKLNIFNLNVMVNTGAWLAGGAW